MSLRIDQHSYGLLKSALILLPRNVGLRVYRVALNAWGGIVKRVQVTKARRRTGLLAKSPKVKVKIPDASFNAAHHGKPAYVLVGPSRDVVGPAYKGQRVSIRKATKIASSGGRIQTRRPSRYAHLVEKIDPFVGPSVEAGATAGMAVFTSKLSQGITAEAAKLAARN